MIQRSKNGPQLAKIDVILHFYLQESGEIIASTISSPSQVITPLKSADKTIKSATSTATSTAVEDKCDKGSSDKVPITIKRRIRRNKLGRIRWRKFT